MTWSPPRRMFSGGRLGAPIFAAVIGVLPVSRPTVADPPPERSGGHANRKEWSGAPAEVAWESDGGGVSVGPRPVETWATIINVHTGEAVALSSAEPSFARFSDVLADRVTGSKIELDRRLLELLRQIALRNPGVRLEIVSGFRSPKLNEMLRKKGHRVASHSQHSLGHAVDFRVIADGATEPMKPYEIENIVRGLGWIGGVGVYPGKNDRFVHCDVGPNRRWLGK